MKKKYLVSVVILFFSCILIGFVDDFKHASAATHIHNDSCYAGHRHEKSGCSLSPNVNGKVYLSYTKIDNIHNQINYQISIRCKTCNKTVYRLEYVDIITDNGNFNTVFGVDYITVEDWSYNSNGIPNTTSNRYEKYIHTAEGYIQNTSWYIWLSDITNLATLINGEGLTNKSVNDKEVTHFKQKLPLSTYLGCYNCNYYTGSVVETFYGGITKVGFVNGARQLYKYISCRCGQRLGEVMYYETESHGLSPSSYLEVYRYKLRLDGIIEKDRIGYEPMYLFYSTNPGGGVFSYENNCYYILNPRWNNLLFEFNNLNSKNKDNFTYYFGYKAEFSCPKCLAEGKITKTYTTNWSCGQMEDLLPDCPQYTVAPSVSFYNITNNTILSEIDTSFYPQIRVYDNENDDIDCNFYLDGRNYYNMSVTGSNKVFTSKGFINAAILTEGSHSIKVKASDNYSMYMGEATVTFKVDKSAPIINSIWVSNSTNSIQLSATAMDSIAGLAASAYRFTINGIMTDWLTSSTYTMNGLTPDTAYSYKVEVRDTVGHVSTRSGSTYTRPASPAATATAMEGGGIQLVVRDVNPSHTLYRVQVGSRYAAANGTLSADAVWFSLPYDATVGGKKLILSGLPSNTAYTITVAAQSRTVDDNAVGVPVSVLTAPGIPYGFTAGNITCSNIQLSWSGVPGAVSYEILRSTLASDGTVTATKRISDIITTQYNDTDVSSDQSYRYIIRCKNQSMYGSWSASPLSVKTLPLPPIKVSGIIVAVDGTSLDITWNPISGVLGYEVEVIYDGKVWRDRVAENRISFDTGQPDCQCSIRVKAFNITSGNDVSEDTLWTNGGDWSNEYIGYTHANIPVLDPIGEGQSTSNSTVINWNTNRNPASVRYKLQIYRSGILENEIIIAGSSAGTNKLTYTVTGLSPETTYSFKLKAVSMTLAESGWSNEISVKTLMEKPDSISSLRATVKSNRVNLLWNPSERAQSYELERDGILIASKITEGRYADTEVSSDTEYSYRVRAVNSTGYGVWSAPLVKKTLVSVPEPENPLITSVTGSSISSIIEWTAVEAITGYDIEADGIIYNVGLNTSYEDNGLLPGSHHVYRVRARNTYGKSDWSEEVTYYTKPVAPEVPVNISASASNTQLRIIWDGVEGALSYDVEIDGLVYSGILASEYFSEEAILSGSMHSVRVRGVNDGGEGEWSAYLPVTIFSEGSISVMPVPSTPSIISSASGSALTCITWSRMDHATMYQLEADGITINTGTGTSYVHAGLPGGSQHVYRVRAGNSGGFSDWSEPVTMTVAFSGSTAPKNMNYYRVSDTITAIVWDKAARSDSYRMEINGVIRNEVFKDTMAEIPTLPGTQYTVRIASVILRGEDTLLEWSDEMVFCTPNTLPAAVKTEKISASSDAILLTWVEVPGAYGYEIEIADQLIKTENILSYTITGLQEATSYTLKIRAYNEVGAGRWSEAVTIMTHEGIPGVPVNIRGEAASAGAATGGAIRIYWDSVDGVDTYEVKVSDGRHFTCGTNEITIGNLVPGENCYVQIRAITEAAEGAWSSRILLAVKLVKPVNIAAEVKEDAVHISWDSIGGADQYEIEIDGIIYTSAVNSGVEITSAVFNVQRNIRVRACYETQRSDWSEAVVFFRPLPVRIELQEGEVVSVVLPYKNVAIDNYRLTIRYNTAELELIDACEFTPVPELLTTYIEDINTHVIITRQAGTGLISFLTEGSKDYAGEGLAGSVKFRSLTSETVEIQYSVTTR